MVSEEAELMDVAEQRMIEAGESTEVAVRSPETQVVQIVGGQWRLPHNSIQGQAEVASDLHQRQFPNVGRCRVLTSCAVELHR